MSDETVTQQAFSDAVLFGYAKTHGYLAEYYRAEALSSVVAHLDALGAEVQSTLSELRQEPREHPMKVLARLKRDELSELYEAAEEQAYAALVELETKPEILVERRNEYQTWWLCAPAEAGPVLYEAGDQFYRLLFGSAFDATTPVLTLRVNALGEVALLNRSWESLGEERAALRDLIEEEVKADLVFQATRDA